MNKKIIFGSLYLGIGATLIVLNCLDRINQEIWAGMAGALIAIGILRIVAGIRYKTDKTYRENYDIEINDERNRAIRRKAWAYAGYVYVLAAAVIMLVMMGIGQEIIMQVLAMSICSILIIFNIAYLIISKRS